MFDIEPGIRIIFPIPAVKNINKINVNSMSRLELKLKISPNFCLVITVSILFFESKERAIKFDKYWHDRVYLQ